MGGVFPSLDLLTELLVAAVLLVYLSWHLPLMGAGLLLGLVLAGGVVVLLRRLLGRRDLGLRLQLQEQMHRWVTDSSHCLRELQLYGRVPAVLERYKPLAHTFAEATSVSDCSRTLRLLWSSWACCCYWVGPYSFCSGWPRRPI